MKQLHHLSLSAMLLVLGACGSGDDEPRKDASGGEAPIDGDGDGDDGDSTSESRDAPSTSPTRDAEPPTTPAAAAFDGCERGTLEADFQAQPFAGPNVVDGALPAGDYVISSTYLALAPDADAQSLFQQLVEPIAEDLRTRPGLVAVSLGRSESCGVARTLAVWEDDAAMIAFVTSAPHAAAMVRVTDISRGGSTVTHWTGDEAAATWASAVEHIGADDGPQY